VVDLPFLNSLILLLSSSVLAFLAVRYFANRTRILDLEKRVAALEEKAPPEIK
jgi:hypothetical protein